MKTKTLTSALFLAVASVSAQIPTPTTIVTPTSITLPDSIPNYDGTFDPFGQSQLYYPNTNEIRYNTKDHLAVGDVVSYYTMNTYPKRYLLNTNNIALGFAKSDTIQTTDSLHRIDLEWQGSNSSAFLTPVDQQENARLNYFTQYFSSSGKINVQGSAAIACQNIYSNIDMVYLSNEAGLVMYFIVYPGGNYKDIIMHINGSKSNSISSGKLKIDANWESMTLEQPQMYQYTMSGGVVTPVNICNSSWMSIGGDTYQLNNTSSFNTSMPLIIQLKQANVTTHHTTGMNWSTYFGGWQDEFPMRTHTDSNDNLYIAGYTTSYDFPQAQGAIGNSFHGADAFITKFNNHGKILWSTYVGGSGEDEIHDFDFDANSVYCVGRTESTDISTFPKSSTTINNSTYGGGTSDGFIFQFDFTTGTSAVLQSSWLTYYGGNGADELNACKFDSQANFFVVGESSSTNLNSNVTGPSGSYQHTFNSAQLGQVTGLISTDAIIAKFDAGTSAQSWFTFYGTDQLGTNANNHSADYFYGITIENSDIHVCGKAGGTNLPNSMNNKFVSGNFDGILAHFKTNGVMSSGDAKYTNGNISNYSVKNVWGKIYTVGQANSSMNGNTSNSGLFYYNATASGNTDGCLSIHDAQNLSLIHNTFLGGSDEDYAYDIQFTSNGLFYIVGGTKSSDFPTWNLSSTTPMYNNTAGNPNNGVWTWDNFVACFQEGNTDPTWSTYLGSGYSEASFLPTYINTPNWASVVTVALDSFDYPYVLGMSNSNTTFPLDEWTGSPVYFQPSKSGWIMAQSSNDATITRFNTYAISIITGIKDFENTKFLLGIYPNPTNKNLVINNSALSDGDLRYGIYDMTGKKLKEGKIKSTDTKSIDVSFLPQGVYVINVTNEKVTLSNKFVKTDN